MTPVKIGTRGSQLALWQARAVAARLAEAGGPAAEIVVIKTSGDRLSEANLSEVGGKGLFVKEIEEALLEGRIDLAVHSAKDMPAVLPEGLRIGAVLPREWPHDALVLPSDHPLAQMPGLDARPTGDALRARFVEVREALGPGPVFGTSSIRRAAQLAAAIPGARFEPVRGNLDTRLRRIDERRFDATLLAAAGLRRLGFASRISALLPLTTCVPAPGQGIVAVEVRGGDDGVRAWLAPIGDRHAHEALEAERALVAALEAGCQAPLGAVALPDAASGQLTLHAVVAAPDGSRLLRAMSRGPRTSAAALGRKVADDLLASGAAELLAWGR